MSKAEDQIRAMPWAQLLALKTVAGRLTIDRINEEINRRIRAAAQSTTETGTGATDLAATGAETQHE